MLERSTTPVTPCRRWRYRKTGQAKQTLSNRGPVPTDQAGKPDFSKYLLPGGWQAGTPRWPVLGRVRPGGAWPMVGTGRNTAQTCANVGQSLALGLRMTRTSRGLDDRKEAGLDGFGQIGPTRCNLGQNGVVTCGGKQPGIGAQGGRHHCGHLALGRLPQVFGVARPYVRRASVYGTEGYRFEPCGVYFTA